MPKTLGIKANNLGRYSQNRLYAQKAFIYAPSYGEKKGTVLIVTELFRELLGLLTAYKNKKKDNYLFLFSIGNE